MSRYLSIGEFADLTWLSAKALRLYDKNGLLPPAAVDPVNGYRLYERRQVDDARLITLLRRLDMPLRAVGEILRAEPHRRGELIDDFRVAAAETHDRRQALAAFLTHAVPRGRLDGQGQPDALHFPVRHRHVPDQVVVTTTRATTAAELPGVIRECTADLLHAAADRGGPAGPLVVIYHGQVGWESDGPIEVCLPVGDPVRGHRREPAHEEAWVDVPMADVQFPRILAAFEAVRVDAGRGGRTLRGAPREVYPARPEDPRPICQIAQPYVGLST